MGRKKYTTEKFIELAKIVFGDKYDYSKAAYVDIHTKVKIICPMHGLFEIRPDFHTNREIGCKQCGFIKASKSRKIGFDEFESRSSTIYKNYYKYSEDSYVDTQHKTTITCPVHGNFEQKVNNHLIGFGCKKCSSAARKLAKLKS